jgi:hypothetical protein
MADLAREEAAARRIGLPLVCRLNVVSDVAWEREFLELFAAFPGTALSGTLCISSGQPEPGRRAHRVAEDAAF